jgi:hypothetical protein
MSDERILGETNFVGAVLSQAGETFDQRYKLKALGYDLHRLVDRAAEIFGLEGEEFFFARPSGS